MRVVLFLVLLGVADASLLSKVFEWRGKLFGYPAWDPEAHAPHGPAKRDAASSYRPPKATCGLYTRDMAVDCFHYLADKNCDHALDRQEVSRKRPALRAGRFLKSFLCVFVGGLGQNQSTDVV